MLDDFQTIFRAPGFVKPYLHHFATPEEMRLVVLMGERELTAAEVAGLWDRPLARVEELLEQAYRKQVLNREESAGVPRYRVAEFYDRLDNFCKFGNYQVLPRKLRNRLDRWCFQEYLRRNDDLRRLSADEHQPAGPHNELVLLLSEAEEMIRAASAIRVVPCNCKMLADNCEYSREVCLILDKNRITDRTGGRDLTREEAIRLVRRLDREGLIHTGGPPDWRQQGPEVICNCCSCCCYPLRAAELLGLRGRWPRSRHVARFDPGKCRHCGACTRRCQFQAFRLDGTLMEAGGKSLRKVVFSPELCLGCGLCANACPAGAITMEPLEAPGPG